LLLELNSRTAAGQGDRLLVARRELACEARRQQYYRRSLVRLCFHVAMGGYSISKENRKDVELEVEKKNRGESDGSGETTSSCD